jgi:hypothetical protein
MNVSEKVSYVLAEGMLARWVKLRAYAEVLMFSTNIFRVKGEKSRGEGTSPLS